MLRYVADLKDASAAEFDEAEAVWRDTVGQMYENLSEAEDVPTPEELDGDDADAALGVIESHVEEVRVAANNWIADTEEWAKVAKARIEMKKKAAA